MSVPIWHASDRVHAVGEIAVAPFLHTQQQFVAQARRGLQMPPPVKPESYIITFALVGVLGGIVAALAYIALVPLD